jgi:hypothetical protein
LIFSRSIELAALITIARHGSGRPLIERKAHECLKPDN